MSSFVRIDLLHFTYHQKMWLIKNSWYFLRFYLLDNMKWPHIC